jgi:hypothetical protein
MWGPLKRTTRSAGLSGPHRPSRWRCESCATPAILSGRLGMKLVCRCRPLGPSLATRQRAGRSWPAGPSNHRCESYAGSARLFGRSPMKPICRSRPFGPSLAGRMVLTGRTMRKNNLGDRAKIARAVIKPNEHLFRFGPGPIRGDGPRPVALCGCLGASQPKTWCRRRNRGWLFLLEIVCCLEYFLIGECLRRATVRAVPHHDVVAHLLDMNRLSAFRASRKGMGRTSRSWITQGCA